jgi:hypothetical protein
MKVHAETIEALIDLYNRCHQVLDDEFNIKTDGEEVLEVAAMDYMSCPQRSRFCSIVDNLDPDVCREMVALMQIGMEPERFHSADFDDLKGAAVTGAKAGRLLIDTQNLPRYWRRALGLMTG